jgi:hypothetical protein
MEVPDLQRYRAEKKKWQENGEPVRSDERVAEIYDTFCAPCEKFIPIPFFKERGQCRECTCLLSKDGDDLNKIRWATTECPLGKWSAEEQYREEKSESKPDTIDPHRGKGRGCGCS